MSSTSFQPDSLYVLNHCTKYLARSAQDFRHDYSIGGVRRPADNVAEAWRFPIVDAYAGGAPGLTEPDTFYGFNQVTLVWADGAGAPAPRAVSVVGSFGTLHTPTPLASVSWEGEPTRYRAISFAVPKGQHHRYKFMVDGVPNLDPVNPQVEMLDNGQLWSAFFTDEFTEPLVTERWELQLLYRLVSAITPFHSAEQENFLQRYYFSLDQATRADRYTGSYRIDSSVGEVNFIDNLLARAERQHLVDYKICLDQIDRVLRQRNPYTEPARMSVELYVELYNQMADDDVPGWDKSRYASPRYFLCLLRRHAVMGSFAHPRYGGNAGASGWGFLGERYPLGPQENGGNPATLFDWRRAIEAPLGRNPDYVA